MGARSTEVVTAWNPNLGESTAAAERMVRLASEASRTVRQPGTQDDFYFQGESYRSATLAALLAYAYANGLTDSQDIARRLREDRAVRALGLEAFPDWTILRRFRRLHRREIEATLAELLRQVGSSQLEAGRASPLLEPRFNQEAAARLDAAVYADMGASDE